MNKGIVRIISVLAVLAVLAGCSSIATQRAANVSDKPILSAAEAQSMIRVTVRTIESTPGALTADAPTVAARLD